jgi:flavodoxin
MKAVVIYDSNFGNTKILAESIAKQIGAQIHSVNDITQNDLIGLDLLIVGSPINAWHPTAKITGFLSSLNPSSLSKVKAAAFDTRIKIFISGNAAKKISRRLQEKGATIITEPRGFYVKDKEGPLSDGEIENAKQWAKDIIQKITNDRDIKPAKQNARL